MSHPVELLFQLLAFIFILGLVFWLNHRLQTYRLAVKQLVKAVTIMPAGQPDHRLQLTGPEEVRQLAQAVNQLAGHFQARSEEEEARLAGVKADLEEERNRLSVLLAELAEGILVCNVEGQILLYNTQAKELLDQAPDDHATNGFGRRVSLGRSVFGLIDRHSITHALEALNYRSQQQRQPLVSQFVTTAANGQLIRARITPIVDSRRQLSSLILVLEDMTRLYQTSRRRDILLQSLIEAVRASLGSIRAAIETIREYPHMDEAKLNQLRQVIYDESLTVSAQLDRTTAEYTEDLKADWQLEEMLGSDLLWAIQCRFEDKLGVTTQIVSPEENLWLKVDSYSVVQAMTYVMGQLKTEYGLNEVTLTLKGNGRLARLDLTWPDTSTDMDKLWTWQNQALINGDEGIPLTLREVAERHGGEVWSQADRTNQTAYLRLLLPAIQPRPRPTMPVSQESRPEYYEFDLFHQPGQQPEVDDRPLGDLTYTVFDTETTGLHPTEGDEIIAIGAVRIVKGRLLRQEIFDQLVDPQRPVSPESIGIHGILPEILRSQPTIEQVLPQFFRFSEGTVLVAHNAAFDMRLLQLKETQTGFRFINPVLDTLLLSAIVQPNQEAYSLEAIAQRLGVNIIGRHTSLGDAILTGEIFLKLIPLLAEYNIVTLKDARQAAQQMYYARLSY